MGSANKTPSCCPFFAVAAAAAVSGRKNLSYRRADAGGQKTRRPLPLASFSSNKIILADGQKAG